MGLVVTRSPWTVKNLAVSRECNFLNMFHERQDGPSLLMTPRKNDRGELELNSDISWRARKQQVPPPQSEEGGAAIKEASGIKEDSSSGNGIDVEDETSSSDRRRHQEIRVKSVQYREDIQWQIEGMHEIYTTGLETTVRGTIKRSILEEA
ncbi:hypothetical protein HAX54_020058 [Datura stramonium]|uniref:Uncharacterized protein n=1 Tax=Datura stramonium TaxID=4076 RepID=A0ABS8UQ98_DATST|nr:hypothetical protein [Datura stramonium]